MVCRVGLSLSRFVGSVDTGDPVTFAGVIENDYVVTGATRGNPNQDVALGTFQWAQCLADDHSAESPLPVLM